MTKREADQVIETEVLEQGGLLDNIMIPEIDTTYLELKNQLDILTYELNQLKGEMAGAGPSKKKKTGVTMVKLDQKLDIIIKLLS